MNKISYKTLAGLVDNEVELHGDSDKKSYKSGGFTWKHTTKSVDLYKNNDLCQPIYSFNEDANIELHYTNEAALWEIKKNSGLYLPLTKTISSALSLLFTLDDKANAKSYYEYYKKYFKDIINKEYNDYINNTSNAFDMSRLRNTSTNNLEYELLRSSDWLSKDQIPLKTNFIHTVLEKDGIIERFYSKTSHIYWRPVNDIHLSSLDLRYNNFVIMYRENLIIAKEFYNINELYNHFQNSVSEDTVDIYFGDI